MYVYFHKLDSITNPPNILLHNVMMLLVLLLPFCLLCGLLLMIPAKVITKYQ